jgi:hypothetical protein
MKKTFISVEEVVIELFELRTQTRVKLLTEDENLSIAEPLFITQQLKIVMRAEMIKQRDHVLKMIENRFASNEKDETFVQTVSLGLKEFNHNRAAQVDRALELLAKGEYMDVVMAAGSLLRRK